MDKLDQLIELRKQLSSVSVTDALVTGTLTLDSHIKALWVGLEDEISVRVNGELRLPASVNPGMRVEVAFNGTALNYYEKLDLFLKHFPDRLPKPRYYVHEIGYISDSLNAPDQAQRYKEAVRLWQVLKGMADHQDGKKVFLLSSDKLEIDCIYSSVDLRLISKLGQFEADFSESAPCRQEKRSIFKRALWDTLGKCSVENRFGELLRNFDSVFDRYWLNYRLFLEGISFDKIFEGYVEKHAKLITELNSVLGGIQTALIGLPIASFVILDKMSPSDHVSFKNSLLGLGCLAFVGFLGLLSISQGRILGASKELAEELEQEVKRKSPDLALKLKPSITRLGRHATWIKRLLFTVRIMLVGLLVATGVTFAYVSFPEAREWFTMRVTAEPELKRLLLNLEGAQTRSEVLAASSALSSYWDMRLSRAEERYVAQLDEEGTKDFQQASIAWRTFRALQVKSDAHDLIATDDIRTKANYCYQRLTEARVRQLENLTSAKNLN